MKQFVKCIEDNYGFTKGKAYEVTHIDQDGDIWVTADDEGDPMFMYPHQCEWVVRNCTCECTCGAK